MTNNPLVSVIVPCYNHQNYIIECIDSVISQTYKNIELIVIDDGSTDSSVEIIKKLQQKYKFNFFSQENRGVSATLNKAIKCYAKGEYIALLASDDFWHPDKIQLQVSFLIQHLDYAMCCSKAVIVNDKSEIIAEFNQKLFSGNYTFKEIALGRSFIPALTTLIKRDVLIEVGLFDEHLLIEDLDMWLKIANRHKIGLVNKVLAYYRRHNTNISSKVIEMTKARFQILEKWKHISPSLYKKIKRNFELLALNDFGKSHPEEAKKYFNFTFKNLLNPAYRRLIFKYFLTRGF